MMDWTDRHCRVFHRLMSRRARLYTEMLTTGAIIHGDRRRLLGFDPGEHPVALQLGGSEPADLATLRRRYPRLTAKHIPAEWTELPEPLVTPDGPATPRLAGAGRR